MEMHRISGKSNEEVFLNLIRIVFHLDSLKPASIRLVLIFRKIPNQHNYQLIQWHFFMYVKRPKAGQHIFFSISTFGGWYLFLKSSSTEKHVLRAAFLVP